MKQKKQEEVQLIRHEGDSDEEYVRTHFWSKVKKISAKIPFLLDAVAMYYCATDSKTPAWARAVAFGALAYFILPFDVIPDILIVAGWTDDAAILAGAIKTLSSKVTDEHKAKADAWAFGRDPEKP